MNLAEKREKKDHVRAMLLRWIHPGARVFTITRRMTPNGMRYIDLYAFRQEDGVIVEQYLSGWVATLLDMRRSDDGEIQTDSHAFDLVYCTGVALWPNGDGLTVTGRNGSRLPETDGGYLLHQVRL